jgi:S1-C subfamily serine protease
MDRAENRYHLRVKGAGMKLFTFLLALVWATAASAEDWWWIGINGDAPNRVLTYVDQASAQSEDGAIWVWVLSAGESPLPNGQQYQATQYALRCRSRSLATVGRVPFDRVGEVMDLAKVPPGDFSRAIEGSIGESVLLLACGRPTGVEVRVQSPIEHAVAYFTGRSASPGPPAPATSAEAVAPVGTGFFIGPDGHILTSHHVVEGARRLACRTADGRIHELRVARISAANDLALLRADVRPAHYLSFAPPGLVRPGDRVFTLGYGAMAYLGINEPRFTEGSVSALSGLGAEDAWMQISVPVQPGNSGGPLLNEAGQVVGIIAAQAAADAFMEAEGVLPQSINWAVKAEYAAPLLGPLAPGPRRTREQAIDLVRNSICLVIVARGGE